MKRFAAAVLLVVGLPIAGVVGAAGPAGACSCIGLGDAEAFARADAVFVGKVSGYEAGDPPVPQPGPARWTFKVRDVYKGKVTRTQEVVSAADGASCGLEIQTRGVFLVFATTSRTLPSGPRPAAGQLYATLCGGTRALSEGALEPGLGRAHPPRSGRR